MFGRSIRGLGPPLLLSLLLGLLLLLLLLLVLLLLLLGADGRHTGVGRWGSVSRG